MIDIEAKIKKNMEVLNISREEAVRLVAYDASIDRMTSAKEIDSDLTAEQQKIAKTARQADRKPTAFKFDTSKRKKADNLDKQFLIDILHKALNNSECQNIEIINAEREIVFNYSGVKYKLVLSAPRS